MKPRPACAATLVLLAAVAWAQYTVPARPTRYATDLAGVMDAARLSALNEQLATFERQTSNQVLVYVDRRLPSGTTIEEFANGAFKAWGVGQKGKDNGVVLFVFVDDRKMRIEVGYGLEGAITDARAGLIVDSVLAPRFRQRDFTGGIEAAALELMSAARGEPFRGAGRTVAESPTGGWRAFLAWGLPPLLGLVVGFAVYRMTGGLHWAGLGALGTSSVLWIFLGTPVANDVRPMILGFGLLLCGAAVAVPIMIGRTLPSTRSESGRQGVGVVLLQAGAGLVLLSLVLFTFSGLGLPAVGLAAKALMIGPLLLVLGGFLRAKDPWEIVTLAVGRIAFLVLLIAGLFLLVAGTAPVPGRLGAVDVAVVSGLVFVMAWIVARSQGWKMGPTSLGTGSGSWGFSSSGGSWSSGGSSSWSSSSSSSSSFSGGGGSSGGGGASGSW